MAKTVFARDGISVRLACQAFSISETCFRYQPKLDSENAEVFDWLMRLNQVH